MPITMIEIDAHTATSIVFSTVGGFGAVGIFGFWLATRFNRVYARIELIDKTFTKAVADHELKDVERFNALNLAILDTRIQEQAKTIKTKP